MMQATHYKDFMQDNAATKGLIESQAVRKKLLLGHDVGYFQSLIFNQVNMTVHLHLK